MLHILFVCTGNTCRSPMAKAIYAEKSAEYGISSICSSAALGFGEGVVSPNSVEVCHEIGIDISDHRPRVIRERDIAITDVFVVMTEMHAQILMGMLGVPMSKIYILGGGIPDPYGSDIETYRECREKIEKGIDDFCRILKGMMTNKSLKVGNDDQPYFNANAIWTP